MKSYLIIYAHPNPKSFNGAVKDTVTTLLDEQQVPYKLIDLYAEQYNPVLSLEEMKGVTTAATKAHQALIAESTHIVFVFPVWWFRAPAILEGFIDKVFVPGFAYRFKRIIGTYGLPMPLLKDKHVLAFITHGAPALPVKTIYVNTVKYRFLLGFLSFCFYLWNCTVVQFWSVPFVQAEKRARYLLKVRKLVHKQLQH